MILMKHLSPSPRTPEKLNGNFFSIECHEQHESTAHRDGSPYPLRTSHLSDPKEVGRTVPVSRKRNLPFFVDFVDFVVPNFQL